jgi:hypothetical protein
MSALAYASSASMIGRPHWQDGYDRAARALSAICKPFTLGLKWAALHESSLLNLPVDLGERQFEIGCPCRDSTGLSVGLDKSTWSAQPELLRLLRWRGLHDRRRIA